MKSATTKCEPRKKKLLLSYEKRMALYLAASSNKSNVFTSTCAQVHTYVHVSCVICVRFTMLIAFIRRTTADLSTFIRGLHTHTVAGQHSKALFFLSSTSFLDIKAFNIERRIAMRGQIPRDRSVLPAGNFGANSPRASTAVSTNREDVRRDCRLLLVERY